MMIRQVQTLNKDDDSKKFGAIIRHRHGRVSLETKPTVNYGTNTNTHLIHASTTVLQKTFYTMDMDI